MHNLVHAKRACTARFHQGQQLTTYYAIRARAKMEHKIVISGEGSAHPKLGVKKKNSVEENLKSAAGVRVPPTPSPRRRPRAGF